MSRPLRLVLILSLLVAPLALMPTASRAQSRFDVSPAVSSTCDPDGEQDSGAIYRICMPPAGAWNGDLVIFAHGYVAYDEPVAIPEDQLCLDDGTCLPDLINGLGYAFATTSYSVNGLAIKQGVADVVDLVDIFVDQYGQPGHVYLTGASEGGLVTTLGTEQYPEVFNGGGLATCGPIGDFNTQISYFGDFRVVFDYFFPGLLPPSPVDIPQSLIDGWDDYYESTVEPAVFDPANSDALRQLVRVTGVAYDPKNPPASLRTSVADVLWYNVYSTNDAIAKLGGQPFDNQARVYRGADDNIALNLGVERFGADPVALAEIDSHYQTSGQLDVSLVTMHTIRDQQVPYVHALLYGAKVLASGSLDQYTHIPVWRYGHCNFTEVEVLVAFALLVLQSSGEALPLADVQRVLPDGKALDQYLRLTQEYGLRYDQ